MIIYLKRVEQTAEGSDHQGERDTNSIKFIYEFMLFVIFNIQFMLIEQMVTGKQNDRIRQHQHSKSVQVEKEAETKNNWRYFLLELPR